MFCMHSLLFVSSSLDHVLNTDIAFTPLMTSCCGAESQCCSELHLSSSHSAVDTCCQVHGDETESGMYCKTVQDWRSIQEGEEEQEI